MESEPAPGPSSPKRRRLDASSTPLANATNAPTQQAADTDALLLQAADAALTASRTLLRRLSKSPSSKSATSQADHATLLELQRKHVVLAITCLRAVVARSEDVEIAVRPSVELIARCLLVETLLRETTEWDEAEAVLNRGLPASQKHENLREYRWRLHALTIELFVSRQSLKLARTTVKRVIAELSAIKPLPAAWLYHFELVNISLQSDPTNAALRELIGATMTRKDAAVLWALRIIYARNSVSNARSSDDEAALDAVSMLAKAVGLPMTLSEQPAANHKRPEALAHQLYMQALCIYALYHSQMTGRHQLCKIALKQLHQALDTVKPDTGDQAGYVRLPISQGSDSIVLAMPSRETLYSYVFLLSAATQRDLAAKQPKGIMFGNEGLQRIEDRLKAGAASNEPTRWLSIDDLAAERALNERMHAELLVQRIEAQIMRSNLVEAEQTIDALVSSTSAAGIWHLYADRAVLLGGLLAQSLGDLPRAIECYTAVRVLSVDGDGKPGELHLLATLALVLARISSGERIAAEDLKLGGDPDELAGLAMSTIAASSTSLPATQVVGTILESIAGGAVSKAKYSLSAALNMVTASSNSHARAAILALLGNLFVHVQNEQATKMLENAYTLARGLGASMTGQPTPDLLADGQPPLGSAVVGHAPLGMWLGKHLQAIYERGGAGQKVRAQVALNAAHEAVLASRASV